MEIAYFNQTSDKTWDQFLVDFEHISSCAFALLNLGDEAEFSVVITKNHEMRELNSRYRNIDASTDVITFALQDELTVDEKQFDEIAQNLGDIFINETAVVNQAEEYGHSIRREICFLFTHGLLHLLGYDHLSLEDEKTMFSLQDEILEGYVSRV